MASVMVIIDLNHDPELTLYYGTVDISYSKC